MFNRLKSAVSGAVEGLEGPRPIKQNIQTLPPKHAYSRPAFLNLSEDAVIVSRDKRVRPVLSVSSSIPLPHNSGYAECVNAGKSILNEDMAHAHQGTLKFYKAPGVEDLVPYTYFAIFDGHAGYGAALDASKQLHHIIHQKLINSIDAIMILSHDRDDYPGIEYKDLIIGCLETSFCEMDEVINESRINYYNPGGCTAIVALFILDEVFVANAGDCRAGICDDDQFIPMSNDFSPFFDKHRIYTKALENPSLLGGKYTTREFLDSPLLRDDLGKTVLYKDPFMSGWAYKTLVSDDLKLPLINGVGRRSRIMGTIGVARGFGDFDLTSNHHKTAIKPLLSCVPEVKMYKLNELSSDSAVLVIASDGLWDAVEPQDVVTMCTEANLHLTNDNHKHALIAMNLVAAARGRKDYDNNIWLLKNSSLSASLDDISVFVIPIQGYRDLSQNKEAELDAASSHSSSSSSKEDNLSTKSDSSSRNEKAYDNYD